MSQAAVGSVWSLPILCLQSSSLTTDGGFHFEVTGIEQEDREEIEGPIKCFFIERFAGFRSISQPVRYRDLHLVGRNEGLGGCGSQMVTS